MTNLIFYVLVLGLTMFQMQIGLILISLVCSTVYHLYLKGLEGVKYLGGIIVIFIISSMINPSFSHKGATLLFFLFTGNPVTLESVIFGMAAAAIICAMLLWFSGFNVIMTTDKVLAGVGAVMPHVAALLTMTFHFVPKFTRQGRAVIDANKALGMKNHGFKSKIKTQTNLFSITTTWALENSVDTADSMRARGYGTGRRTSYNNYRFQIREIIILLWILLLSAIVCIGLAREKVVTYYYPAIEIKGNAGVYISHMILCSTPLIINIWEAVRWHRLKSKI